MSEIAMSIPVEAWKIVMRDGLPIVKMCCPGCGMWSDLGDHDIASDGSVSPSIVCPNDGTFKQVVVGPSMELSVEQIGDRATPCSFHSYVKLAGWIGGRRAEDAHD